MRVNGVAASQVTREIRQDKGDRRTEDSDDNDPGPVPPLLRLREYSADLHPLSLPTIGGSEEDWTRSDNEVPDGELRRRVGTKHRPDIPAHTCGPPKRRKGSTCTRESSKRREGISVGPTALEPPAQLHQSGDSRDQASHVGRHQDYLHQSGNLIAPVKGRPTFSLFGMGGGPAPKRTPIADTTAAPPKAPVAAAAVVTTWSR